MPGKKKVRNPKNKPISYTKHMVSWSFVIMDMMGDFSTKKLKYKKFRKLHKGEGVRVKKYTKFHKIFTK